MRKNKLLAALALTSLCCTAVGTSAIVANAASVGEQKVANVIANLADDKVTLTDYSGNELFIAGGAHNGANPASKATLTDGVVDSFWTAKLVDAEGNGALGYITLDAGAEYVVSSMLVDFVHDWGAKEACVELSSTADFADPIVIYSNIAGKEFSADSTYDAYKPIINKAWQGLTFNFSPVPARYVRITGNLFNNIDMLGYTSIGEVQLFGVTEGLAVAASEISGTTVGTNPVELKANDPEAQIFYTLDGSVPTKNSTLYEAPIVAAGTAKVRAVAYKDGKYSKPEDFVFYGKAPFASVNAASGKEAKFYNKDLTAEIDFDGFNGAAKDAFLLTDGSTHQTASCLMTVGETGWAVIDLGEELWLNKFHVTYWLSGWIGSDEVKVACKDDFSDAVTVSKAALTAQDAGTTVELETPVKARYVLAYGDWTGTNQYCVFSEIEAWTCEAPEEEPFVSVNAASGKEAKFYNMDLTAEIDYAGFNGAAKDAFLLTDGSQHQTASCLSTVDSMGWAVIDLGEELWLNKFHVTLWLSGWVDGSMSVATKSDFSDAQKIWSFPVGAQDAGNDFELETPVKARYLMVTSNWLGEGKISVFSEIGAWTCEEPEFITENVARGKAAKFYNKDLTAEIDFDGFNGAAKDEFLLTDGSTHQTASCLMTVGETGWAVIDLGQEYLLNKFHVTYWLTGWIGSDELKVACKDDFSDAKTVLKSALYGIQDAGTTVTLVTPVRARYVLAYGDWQGTNEYCVFSEIEAWTCDPNAFYPENVALGKGGSFISKDLSTTLTVKGFDACPNGDASMFTDGDYSPWTSAIYAVDAEGNAAPAWAVVDLGDNYWINKVIYSFWNDQTFTNVEMKLASKADLSDAKTIYTVASMTCTQNAGTTAEFEASYGRYLMVYGEGPWANHSVMSEIQAYTCEPGALEEDYEYKNYLASVEDVAPVEVYVNKDFAELGLPTTLAGKLSDGSDVTIDVSWKCDNYDKTVAGDYVATLVADYAEDAYELLKITVNVKVLALDKTALDAAIAAAGNVNAGAMTTSTVGAFNEAKAAAEALSGYLTQAEVDAAAKALNDAISGLVAKGDVSALTALVNEVKALTAANYTTESWTAVATALTPAEAAVAENGNADLTQADVDVLKAALQSAKDALVIMGNADELNAYYAQVKTEIGYSEDDTCGYTKSTFFAYMDKMYAAEAIAEAATSGEVAQTEIDECLAALKAAVAALVKSADLTALQAAVAEAKALKAEDYTASTYAVLAEALPAIEAVASKPANEQVQADADKALADLNAAVAALVKAGDQAALKAAIAEKGNAAESSYSAATYAVYEQAVWAANQLKDNAEADEATVNAAIEALNAAFAALVKLGDRAALQAAIDKASALTTDNETAQANLASAIAYATQMVEFEGEITEAQVAEAIALLVAAENSIPAPVEASGCGSAIGGALATVVTAMLAMVVIRKKEGINE